MLQLLRGESAQRAGCLSHVSLDFVDACLIVESSHVQVLPAVDGAMIGVLQYPYLSSAFGRIELCHRPQNIQEDVLHNVFRLTRVANDFEGNAQDKTGGA